MSRLFRCPYLDADVVLSEARERHIIEKHPGTLPEYLGQMTETVSNPDEIRQSDRDPEALMFCKWFDTIRTGRYLIAVVIHEGNPQLPWIVTAYTARKVSRRGKQIWPIDP